MRRSFKIFTFLMISISLLTLNGCDSKKEKNTDQKSASTEEKSQSQYFVEDVEAIHKKEKFLSEDFVSYQINYQFGNLSDELKVKAATDLSNIEISSKNFGKSYYNGENMLIDAMANMGEREAKRNFQLVYFYHVFFHLNEEGYLLNPVEATTFLDSPFKQINVTNQAFHTAIFPIETTFLVEDRTNMMKGIRLKTSLIGNDRKPLEVDLHYDRFITVNYIPVSLSWKFYPENTTNEEDLLGEAQVTRIKYYTKDQLQLNIPENAKALKNSPLL